MRNSLLNNLTSSSNRTKGIVNIIEAAMLKSDGKMARRMQVSMERKFGVHQNNIL